MADIDALFHYARQLVKRHKLMRMWKGSEWAYTRYRYINASTPDFRRGFGFLYNESSGKLTLSVEPATEEMRQDAIALLDTNVYNISPLYDEKFDVWAYLMEEGDEQNILRHFKSLAKFVVKFKQTEQAIGTAALDLPVLQQMEIMEWTAAAEGRELEEERMTRPQEWELFKKVKRTFLNTL